MDKVIKLISNAFTQNKNIRRNNFILNKKPLCQNIEERMDILEKNKVNPKAKKELEC
jgi:hypothetical protein